MTWLKQNWIEIYLKAWGLDMWITQCYHESDNPYHFGDKERNRTFVRFLLY